MKRVEPKHSDRCTVMGYPDGSVKCVGYHCPYCGEACSSQGHECKEKGRAIIERQHERIQQAGGDKQ